MDTVVVAGVLLLVLLGIYLYTLFLPQSPAGMPAVRRHISAIVCLIGLSCAAAAFSFHPLAGLHWLGFLIWAVMPGIAAGTAGNRPFSYLLASSVGAALAMGMLGRRSSSDTLFHTMPVLGFILVVIVVNVLGTFLLLPLLAMWEHRRKKLQQTIA